LLLALHYSGLWVRWISHPWWSLSSTLHGLIGGIILTVALHFGRRRFNWAGGLILAFCAVFLAISVVVTYWGKTTFALSYGEDAFAGRFWFFGFKAINLWLFTTLVFALSVKAP